MNLNKLFKIILLYIYITFISGCSTIVVHSEDNIIPPAYAGTKRAIKETRRQWDKGDLYGVIVLYAFDVPFSAIADTLIYPVDLIRDDNK